jgi:addiction module RelE/StbE family toxin
VQGNVLQALEGLRREPLHGKKLQGQLAGLYSLRVWPYRIIYQVSHKTITILVVAIGQRKDVYQN